MTPFGALYHEQFFGSPAEKFCVDRWLDLETVRGWGLGFVQEPAIKAHARFRGCLTIPYWDGRGREITVRYRPITDEAKERAHGAKYLSLKDDGTHIFGLRYVEYPRVFLAEGEIDAMTLWQLGFKAVGLPGAKTWKHHWRWHFRNSEEVVIATDPDEAGRLAAAKIYRDLERITTVSFLKLEHDINDTLREWGRLRLTEYLTNV